jgi:hypothetical protein
VTWPDALVAPPHLDSVAQDVMPRNNVSQDEAVALRSAKGILSLVWKAGFSMRLAVPLQSLLARLGPAALVTSGPGGSFPLGIDEMRWQIRFLSRSVR